MRRGVTFLAFTALFMTIACSQAPQEKRDASTSEVVNNEYVASIDRWHSEREEDLQKKDGWLALAGLYWLEPGINSFGSAKGNSIVFPFDKIAPVAGNFILDGDVVRLQVREGIAIEHNGKPVQQQDVVYSSEMKQPPLLTHGSLQWVVIKRGEKYGVRLWDAESEARKAFAGIKRFPVQQEWKLEARLERHPLPKQIAITNVLGQTSSEPSPGAVVFTLNGQQYRLDALEEGEELFIIFADKTNGSETYGSGRYLYMPKPGPDGKTVIDFNKAYNPPCAFTGYATCPLPPKQNFLPLNVTAGEKVYYSSY
ncbi:DUF1684 domain-containing protein [Pontibacter locisalis]|uniref:DUF1684 domain-containing protein n=1 Tax=Pontibacter locisalis TaxID=1719035 RepID=A0ABW5ILZ5_9BACT